MSPARTLATTVRVLSQLKHDPRTIALIFIVPSVLLTIMKYVFQGRSQQFSAVAPVLLGIFPMIMMFLVTSIITLRERKSGTLERLMTSPIAKLDFILGYGLAFCLIGLIQACVTTFVMLELLKVTVLGGTIPTILSAVLSAFLGTSLGLFTSAFAKSEFQAVQFLPAFMFPQLLTCGLFVARSDMSKLLQWFADIMPLTYSVDAMKHVTSDFVWSSHLTKDFIIVGAYAFVALILASMTIRRQE